MHRDCRWRTPHSTKMKFSKWGEAISRKSLQGILKSLNFRKANHSTEYSRNSRMKINWNRNSSTFCRKFGYILREVVLFFGNYVVNSQVSCFDRVIATHAPSRNWTVLDDSENIGTQLGKNLMSQKKY